MAFRTTSAEDRFGYSESGTMRVQFPHEKLLVYTEGALAVLGTIMVFVLIRVNDSIGLFTLLLKSGVSLVWIFICASIAKLITTGEMLRYSADEKQLRFSIPKKADEIFYYEDVDELRFTPLRLFTKEHGWVVVVRTKYREFRYNYIYTGNKVNRSPEGSPFNILIERCGLVRGQGEGNTIIYKRRTQQ